MYLLVLIFAHLIADYPLQGDFLAKMKGSNMHILAVHAGIWTGTILTATYLLGYSVGVYDVVWLFTVHAVADYLKAKQIGVYKNLDPLKGGLALDQSIHLAQILDLMLRKGMI